MKRALLLVLPAAMLLVVVFLAGYRTGLRRTSVKTRVRVDTVVIERPGPDTVWRERTVVRRLARAERNPAQQARPEPAAGLHPVPEPELAHVPDPTIGAGSAHKLNPERGPVPARNPRIGARSTYHPDPPTGAGPMPAPTVSAVLPGRDGPAGECAAAPSTHHGVAVGSAARDTAGSDAFVDSGRMSRRARADFRAACSPDRTGIGRSAASASGGDSGSQAMREVFAGGYSQAAVPVLSGGDSVLVEVPIDRYVFADSTYRAEVTGYDVRMERMEVYPRTVVRTIRGREPSRWGVSVGIGVGITSSGRVEPALQLHVGWRLFPLGRRRER